MPPTSSNRFATAVSVVALSLLVVAAVVFLVGGVLGWWGVEVSG